ncbi:MAG TPA: permease-like cell division protein FtsX [Thermoanaerobaculia bacterium]|nr:permease-like cell division protein FtsX [Thermoanaerobaculia bacterium]
MIRSTSMAAALLDEAISGLWRARRMTGLSVLLIAVSIFLVGVFLLAAENLRGVTETVRDETAVTVFLKGGASDADRQALEKVVAESRLVAKTRRVTPEEAKARFSSSWGMLTKAVTSLPTNPFPESYELDLIPEAVSSEALRPFLANLGKLAGVDEVQFDVEWVRRLRGIVSLVTALGLALGILLAFGAAFTITNVVRLTILLHRDEIEILRLVGAPEVLIRGPFLLGGLAQGVLGGLVALALLASTFHGVLRYVAATHNVLLGVFVLRFLSPTSMLVLVGGGLVAGVAGGAVAVRRKMVEG